jgi:hypothetical protein
MKKKIAEYITPDLSEFDKRLAVVEENSQKAADYTRDIKNDLKADVRRLETVVEGVERNSKQAQRETDKDVREVRSNSEREIKELKRELDSKIKKALDNPLAN